MTARDIAQFVLLVVVLFWLAVLLSGCTALRTDDTRQGSFTVDADCEEDQVNVNFNLDLENVEKEIEVTK